MVRLKVRQQHAGGPKLGQLARSPSQWMEARGQKAWGWAEARKFF